MESPYHKLRVARIVDETKDARSLVLGVPKELRERFAYRAGQFLTFRVPVGEQRLVRCYSLASSPDTDDEYKVTVKRIADGRVSNWMNDAVHEGDVLEVMRPAGHFCLTERNAPVVLFGAGSGITPVISLVKTALATTERPVRLLYANQRRDAVIFAAELAELERTHPGRLAVLYRLDDESGFLDEEGAARWAAGAKDADFYVCGPGPFMDVVEKALLGLDVAPERIFIERFEYDEAGAPTAAPPDTAAAAAAATGTDAPTITVTLDGATREIPWSPGQTVVQAARAAGIDPPTACEEGYCACCMARLEAGEGEMKANDVLGKRELSEGWVLTCQFVPKAGGVRVRYPD